MNVKQCSKRGLNDNKEYGLLFVSILVKLRIATCVSVHVLALFLRRMSVIINVLFIYVVHCFMFRSCVVPSLR